MENNSEKGSTYRKSRDAFPSTHITDLLVLHNPDDPRYERILDGTLRRYFNACCAYVLRRGYSADEAIEITVAFFGEWVLRRRGFERYDPGEGRFRAFFCTSLRHFVSNWKRKERKVFPDGTKSLNAYSSLSHLDIAVSPVETPEEAFERVYLLDLLKAVLESLCGLLYGKGMQIHYELFRRHFVEPILLGTEKPELTRLAEEFGMDMKKADAKITTARRAYIRLLKDEVRLRAASEEEAQADLLDLYTRCGIRNEA